jgi:carbon-monoxide dehydrogenase medium subunit
MVVFYRRMPRFDYLKPGGLGEVLDLLDGAEEGQYRVFAGGTDLIAQLKAREISAPGAVIDLKGIGALSEIGLDEDGGLRLGATVSVSQVAASALVGEKYPALAEGAREIASLQIQNRATITGNICNAVSSADSAPPLLALGAKLQLVRRGGERIVDLADFFSGPGQTIIEPGELVREIRLPPPPEGARSVYLKLAPRGRMDLAWVGVAAAARIKDGKAIDPRIGLGAVAPTPLRARGAEEVLRGQKLDTDIIEETARVAAGEVSPREDSFRASADYRRQMVQVLVRRALGRLAA